MNRKYLDDISVTNRWDTWGLDDEEAVKEHQQQQSVYGFDARETFNLDHAFYLWLYERLMMYKEISVVNLEFHKFDFHGETYTQLQLIDRILDDLRFIFREDYDDLDPEQFKREREIGEIWAIILPAMWW